MFSTRFIQAPNAARPRTDSYTRWRAYNPRSGASGKFHSPALKQKPLSIISAEYSAAAPSRKKIVCRPLVLQVHLLQTSITRKSARLDSPRNCSSDRKSHTVVSAGLPRYREPNCFPAWQGARPRPSCIDPILGVRNQILTHLDDVRFRHTQSQPRRQSRTEQFVRQDPQSLGIVLKLCYVVLVVRTPHQMRLRAPAHSSDLFQRHHHLARMLAALAAL